MQIDDRTIALIDLAGAADDHRPGPDDLAGAPTISGWDYAYYPGTTQICLVGHAVGHPRLPDGPTTTRPLVAIDTQEGWARTQGRYYKLGNHALGRLAEDDG